MIRELLAEPVEAGPRLRVFTLGRFSVVRDGHRVAFSGKAQARPLDLLRALIALGGRDVSKSKLANAIWSQSADEENVLSSTLYRLRRLLGDESAVVISDGCVSLAFDRCWVDAWQFEKTANELENSALSLDQATSLWGQISELYQGHFLERACEQPWALPYRRRLRSRYLRLAVILGETEEKENRWTQAGDIYRTALERDPFSERLNFRLMRCYYRAGLPIEAVRLFRDYRELTQKYFSTDPGEKMKSLYRDAVHVSHGIG